MAWGGGRGGKDKSFPWGALGGLSLPRDAQSAHRGSARPGQARWFSKGTANIQFHRQSQRSPHPNPLLRPNKCHTIVPNPTSSSCIPNSHFPFFSLFLPLFPGQAQAAAGILEPGSHRVWAPPNKQRVNKIPPVSHTFSPLPPLIPSFFPLEFNVGFCLSPTPPPPPGCNFFQLCKPRGRARCPTGGVGEWQWEKPL